MALILRKHWRPNVGGRIVRYVPGDELPDIHPKRDWLLRYGIAEEVDTDASDDEPEDHTTPPEENPGAKEDTPPTPEDPEDGDNDPDPEVPNEAVKRPPKVAKLDVWQKYAKTQGVNPKGLTKDELIARLS